MTYFTTGKTTSSSNMMKHRKKRKTLPLSFGCPENSKPSKIICSSTLLYFSPATVTEWKLL